MKLEFLKFYRTSDGRYYTAGQIAVFPVEEAQSLIPAGIAREFKIPQEPQQPTEADEVDD